MTCTDVDIAISMDHKSEFGRGGGRNGEWCPKEELMKVVWEKRGRGRGVNLSLHSHACVLLVFSLTYEWVWELGQVGEC